METDKARSVIDAITLTRNPRLDFRTEEARQHTSWMDEHLTSCIYEGCRLLDIGCGAGKSTFKCEELGARVTGIDCSPEAIQFAREIAQDLGSEAEFVEGDFTCMTFGDGSFDLALFAKNIVECSYAEVARLAQSLKRILRSGGRLILTMRDGLDEVHRRDVLNRYVHFTGRIQGRITVPEFGDFEYPTYFWTTAFAIHVVGEHLPLEVSKPMSERDYFLIFRCP